MNSKNKKGFRKTNKNLFVALLLLNLASAQVTALAETAQHTDSPDSTKPQDNSFKPREDAQKLLASIADLVKEFFPKAKIISTANSLHFEYKVHERMHPYNRRTVLSPDLDGILGDIEVKSGSPSDRIVGVIERPEAVHSVLLMAPYSASDKSWMSTRLVFQPITPLEFMESFKKLVATYDHPDTATPGTTSTSSESSSAPKVDSAESNSQVNSITPPAVSTTLATVQSKGSESTTPTIVKETTQAPVSEPALKGDSTANRPLDKYTYPEGRFKVLLPGSPQVKYSDQAGMRMVDYVYAVPEGTFNISYVILAATPPNLKTSQLLDNMAQSVVNSLKGMQAKQYASSLQGYPGCQLEVPELADKPGQGARFRIYIVQNFIYIIGLSGKKNWLSSSNAKEFLDSFQVNQVSSARSTSREPTSNQAPIDRAARMREYEISRMQRQKDSEKARADREFNRYR